MSRKHPGYVLGASPDPSDHELSKKEKILKYLTLAQRCSAPFLSLYVGIHLAAPIAANFGGSALSTNVMVRTDRSSCFLSHCESNFVAIG